MLLGLAPTDKAKNRPIKNIFNFKYFSLFKVRQVYTAAKERAIDVRIGTKCMVMETKVKFIPPQSPKDKSKTGLKKSFLFNKTVILL